jgi:hypothetical protein
MILSASSAPPSARCAARVPTVRSVHHIDSQSLGQPAQRQSWRGTTSSNPAPSSGESANRRSLARSGYRFEVAFAGTYPARATFDQMGVVLVDLVASSVRSSNDGVWHSCSAPG